MPSPGLCSGLAPGLLPGPGSAPPSHTCANIRPPLGKRPLCAQLGTGALAHAVSCSPSLGHHGPGLAIVPTRPYAPGPPGALPPRAGGQMAPIHHSGCPCSCLGGSGLGLTYGLCSPASQTNSSRNARRGSPDWGFSVSSTTEASASPLPEASPGQMGGSAYRVGLLGGTRQWRG